MRELEEEGDNFGRLALMEELKTMPFGDVWDFYCLKQDVPAREEWIEEVRRYEAEITSKRV